MSATPDPAAAATAEAALVVQTASQRRTALGAEFRGWWRRAGGPGDGAGAAAELIARWSSPGRHYHTLDHLAACLGDFRPTRLLARDPLAVELALWCHDAVHDPRRDDNETISAELGRTLAAQAGWPCERAAAVAGLVLATMHRQPPADDDAALLLDVDLAILGAAPAAFAAYEAAVRAEYAWVDEATFRRVRAGILARFLVREPLYRLRWFQVRYEAQARANLRASIAALRA
jgi:predicted metal-dependent HD superfamily phosphohydrolase